MPRPPPHGYPFAVHSLNNPNITRRFSAQKLSEMHEHVRIHGWTNQLEVNTVWGLWALCCLCPSKCLCRPLCRRIRPHRWRRQRPHPKNVGTDHVTCRFTVSKTIMLVAQYPAEGPGILLLDLMERFLWCACRHEYYQKQYLGDEMKTYLSEYYFLWCLYEKKTYITNCVVIHTVVTYNVLVSVYTKRRTT